MLIDHAPTWQRCTRCTIDDSHDSSCVHLDHLFICCNVGAPEAERLVELGLVEGAPNTHPGQGTANRRFFFENAFSELLWVSDPAEAQSAVVRRTCLWERWSQRAGGACPFGIGLRPARDEQPQPPFPTWEYRPPYLPDPLVIQMGTNSDVLTEPLLFYTSFGRRPDSDEPARRQSLAHAQPWREITRVSIAGPEHGEVSPALREVEAHCPWLSLQGASEHLMEVGFDEEQAGQVIDLRPELPLVCGW